MTAKLATFESTIEQANEIKAALPYLNNLPADTAELVDGLILRLELAHARGLNSKLAREAEPVAEVVELHPRAESILEREKACARRAAKAAVVEATEAKAKAPAGKRRGKDLEVQLDADHNVVVRPGLSIRLHGIERNRRKNPVTYDKTYEIGDTVAMDSYNLVYMGQIVSIGAKTVTIKGNLGTKRLNLERFSWFNRLFDLEDTARRNAEESYYL